MSAKHTPGPWATEFDGEHWNVVCDQDGFEHYIVGNEGLFRCDGSDEANASLIAAAPDLLEALQGILSVASVRIDDPRIAQWDAARAAIAKATGGAT